MGSRQPACDVVVKALGCRYLREARKPHSASPPFVQYQIIPLGNKGTCVCVCEQLAQSRYVIVIQVLEHKVLVLVLVLCRYWSWPLRYKSLTIKSWSWSRFWSRSSRYKFLVFGPNVLNLVPQALVVKSGDKTVVDRK